MSQAPQAKYYYYEKNGTKQGPFTIQQIYEHIKNKFVVMDMIIEYDNHKITAGDFVNRIKNKGNMKNKPDQRTPFTAENSEPSTYGIVDNPDSTVNPPPQQTLYYIIGNDNRPINKAYNLRQLQMLVNDGKIAPDTLLESPGIGRISAMQIPDLNFPGPIGSNGPTGPTGPNGPIGPNGAIGSNGPTGPNGPTGFNEPVGFNGANAFNGQAGPNGQAGFNEQAGFNGQTGFNGTNGWTEFDRNNFTPYQTKQSFIAWLFDLNFKNIRVLDFFAVIIKIEYALSIVAGICFLVFATFAILFGNPQNPSEDLPLKILFILFAWLFFSVYLILSKLASEYVLVFVRWMSLTLTASEMYINQNQNRR